MKIARSRTAKPMTKPDVLRRGHDWRQENERIRLRPRGETVLDHEWTAKNVTVRSQRTGMSEMRLPSSGCSCQSRWRETLRAVLWLVLLILLPGPARGDDQASPPIRFGVTPAIVHDQYGVLDDWRIYLEQRKLQRKVEFVSRDSYRRDHRSDLPEEARIRLEYRRCPTSI